MTLLQMEYFLKIVERGSFSKAAAELFRAQPTISRAIVALEEELGVQLFYREKGVSLTSAGQVFYDKAQSVLCAVHELSTAMEQCKDSCSASLRISYHHLDSALSPALMQCLRSMTVKHPNITVFIREYASVKESLLSSRKSCDVVFTLAYDVKGKSNVTYEAISPDMVMAVLPAGHPLSHRDCLHMRDLTRSRILLPGVNLSALSDDIIYAFFTNSGFPLKHVQVVSSAELLAPLILTGEGIALAPMSILRQSRLDGTPSIQCLPVVDCKVGLDIVAAWRADDPNPAIPLFIEEMKHWMDLTC
ncbi:LysR family transcriptional regulator [Pseudoflavonifractor phocaeensis]|uniref:LysR family transcriptional regulator n=1 Tax=Pseudoflavonifractor phocaeensis TaxID=1870988 RepID=UPI00195E688E|nr:LysR family transcriptional regulator [Pseudoflavonifractor phocaeensis]MBM6924418.1 LysR family transcriptional regulator [Pseudoflavonifractor phocaeensis]